MKIKELVNEDSDMHQRIVQLLTQRPLSAAALAADLGVVPTVLQPYLQQLVQHGRVNIERGRGEPVYVIAW